jgi:hypothetical protein
VCRPKFLIFAYYLRQAQDMTMKGFGTGVCVYCGRGDARTIGEHVFGRQLFLIRHRNRLPKVPSCEACNTTKSQLENYLMAITPLGANHSTAKEYAELNLPRRFAGNRPLHRSVTESLGRGDNGRLAYAADSAGVLEWVLMVTKGLFAYHFHRPLHNNWEPRVRHVTAAQEAEGIATMQALVAPGPEVVHRNLGEGTVEYWGQRSRRLPYCSFWRFILFGGLEWSGNSEAPHETYNTILCGTLRKEAASSVMAPDERQDWASRKV